MKNNTYGFCYVLDKEEEILKKIEAENDGIALDLFCEIKNLSESDFLKIYKIKKLK